MITVSKLYFTGNTHRLIVHAKDQLNTAQQSNPVSNIILVEELNFVRNQNN